MKERIVRIAEWLAAAALSAYACSLVVIHATPVDRALPLIAAVLASVAVAHRTPAILVAVPALIAAEVAIPTEEMRLLTFGVIVAAAILATRIATPVAPIASLILLRWIPLDDVFFVRELFLLAIAVAIIYVLGNTPFANAVAVIAIFVTPAVPLRSLALPLLVLSAAVAARVFGMPRLRVTVASMIAIGFPLLFFAWSGIAARAWPYFMKLPSPRADRILVNHALGPSSTTELTIPPGARSLIVSGANLSRFQRGYVIARIEPGGAAIRIGDSADWGYMRRDHFYASRNPLPRDPAGKIRGYGYSAWVDGAGRVPLPRDAMMIRITAADDLPRDASLQVEAFELGVP